VVSEILQLVLRRKRRVLWSVVSNAALKSREMTMVDLHKSDEWRV